MDTMMEQTPAWTMESEAAANDVLKHPEAEADEKEDIIEAAEPKRKKYGDIVVIKRSGRDGGRFPILNDTNILIGRSENCNIRVVIETASEQHVLITVERSRVFLKNLAKMRGSTFVNNCVVMPNEKKALFSGDVVAVCDRKFRIELTPGEKTPAKHGASTNRRSVSCSPAKVLSMTQKGNGRSSRAGSASPARTIKTPNRALVLTSSTTARPLPSKIPMKQRSSLLASFRIGQLPRPLIDPFASPTLEESLKERRLSSWSQQGQSTPRNTSRNVPSSPLIDLDVPVVSPLGQPQSVRTRHLLDATLTPDAIRNGRFHSVIETVNDSLDDRPAALNDSSKTLSEATAGHEVLSALDENVELVPPTPTSQMPPFHMPVVAEAPASAKTPAKVFEQPASNTPKRPVEASPQVATENGEHEGDDEEAVGARRSDVSQLRRSSRSRRASSRGQQDMDTSENSNVEYSSVFDVSATPHSASKRRSANASARSVRAEPPKLLDDATEEEQNDDAVQVQSSLVQEKAVLSPKSQLNQSIDEHLPDLRLAPCELDVSIDMEEEAMDQSTVVNAEEPLVEVDRPQSVRRSTRGRLASSDERRSAAAVDQSANDQIEEQPTPIEASSARRSSTRRSAAKRQSSVLAEKSPSIANHSVPRTPKQAADDRLIDFDASQTGSPLLGRSQQVASTRHLLDTTLTPRASGNAAERRESTATLGDSFGDQTPVQLNTTNAASGAAADRQGLTPLLLDADDHVPPTPTCQMPPFQPVPVVVSAPEEGAPNVAEEESLDKSAESVAEISPLDVTVEVEGKESGGEKLNETNRSEGRRRSSRRQSVNSAKRTPSAMDSDEQQKANVEDQSPKSAAPTPRRSSSARKSTKRQSSLQTELSQQSPSPRKSMLQRVTGSPRDSLSTSDQTPVDEVIDNSTAEDAEEIVGDVSKRSIEATVNEQPMEDEEVGLGEVRRRSSRRPSVQTMNSPSPRKSPLKRMTGTPREPLSTPNKTTVDELMDESVAENAEELVVDTIKGSVEVANSEQPIDDETSLTEVRRRSSRRSSLQTMNSPSPRKPLLKRTTGSPRDRVSTPNQTPVNELIDDSVAENAEEVVGDTTKESIEVTSNEQSIEGESEVGLGQLRRRSSRRSASTDDRQLMGTDEPNETEDKKTVEEMESPITSVSRRSSSARRSSSMTNSMDVEEEEESADDTATEATEQTLVDPARLLQLGEANTPPRFTPPRSPRVPVKSTLRHPRVAAASVSEAPYDSLRKVEFTPEPIVKLIPRIGTKSVRETERLENEEKKAAAQKAIVIVKEPSPKAAATPKDMVPASPVVLEETSPLSARWKRPSSSAQKAPVAKEPSPKAAATPKEIDPTSPVVLEETSPLSARSKRASSAAQKASVAKEPSPKAATPKEMDPTSPVVLEETSPRSARSKRSSSAASATPSPPAALAEVVAEPQPAEVEEDASDKPAVEEHSPSPAKTPKKRALRSKTTTVAEEDQAPAPKSTKKPSTAKKAAPPSKTAHESTPEETSVVAENIEPAAQRSTRKKAVKAAAPAVEEAPLSSTKKVPAGRRAKRTEEPAEAIKEPVSTSTRVRRTNSTVVEATVAPPAKRRTKAAAKEDVIEAAVDSPIKVSEKSTKTTRTKQTAKKAASKTEEAPPAAKKAASRTTKRTAAQEEPPASPPKRGRRAMKTDGDETASSTITDVAPASPAKSRTKKATAAPKTVATAAKKKQATGKTPATAKKDSVTAAPKDAPVPSPPKRGRRAVKNADDSATSTVAPSPPKQRASKAAAAQKPTAAAGKVKATSKKSAVVVEAPVENEKSTTTKRSAKKGKEAAAVEEIKPTKSTRGRRPAVVEASVEEPPAGKRKVPARTKKN
uniref:FHA domain-containing protein n=1 Tax=Plectus sambesii TaxID=2011161 RepID=A0A914W919_9BILA